MDEEVVKGGIPADLRRQLDLVETRWSVRLGRPFRSHTSDYVAPAVRRDGLHVVVKIGVSPVELRKEARALQVFDGRGCVRLLETDMDLHALMLERALPGTPLDERLEDVDALTAAANVMRRLHRARATTAEFETVEAWGSALTDMRRRGSRLSNRLPQRLLERAETLFRELAQSATDRVLLHGDLHHGNILEARNGGWLAVDPKGVVGEPEYETGAFLRNPMPSILRQRDLPRLQERRAHRFSELLGMDPQRILRWSFAQAVLAACWGLEDGQDGWERWLIPAEAAEQVFAPH